ncbi:hypothetical protein [Natrinema thermotolerans]
MTSKTLMRRVGSLALAAALLISLATASAAAVPDPDEVDYPEELVECPEASDAVNPFSETNTSEYMDCKEKRTAQWVERTIKKDIENSLYQIQNLEERANQLQESLESQAERATP